MNLATERHVYNREIRERYNQDSEDMLFVCPGVFYWSLGVSGDDWSPRNMI